VKFSRFSAFSAITGSAERKNLLQIRRFQTISEFSHSLDPETIRPKRAYRRNRYFARNELSRLCLSVLRTAAGEPLSTDNIAGRVIAAKGFDSSDGILRAAIRDQIGAIVKRLHREGAIENIGAGRASKWKLAGA
jgi:hypothetical protein